MFDAIKRKSANNFYPVKEEWITEAEAKLKIKLPDSLVRFYREVGYGFLDSANRNINRIMDPLSIVSFYEQKDQFEDRDDLLAFAPNPKQRLAFLEVNEDMILSIDGKSGNIFDEDQKISDNLDGFLTQYQEDERFFL